MVKRSNSIPRQSLSQSINQWINQTCKQLFILSAIHWALILKTSLHLATYYHAARSSARDGMRTRTASAAAATRRSLLLYQTITAPVWKYISDNDDDYKRRDAMQLATINLRSVCGAIVEFGRSVSPLVYRDSLPALAKVIWPAKDDRCILRILR